MEETINSEPDTMYIGNIKMGFFYRFFSWCSGARLYLLKSCPTDYNKFLGIGVIIFLTGIMASITGFYALFMIFNSLAISIIFGVFWGILIFFLDWFIVSSLKKEEKVFSELLFSIPRLLLAVLLAVVISKPLELKLFEKEINGVLQNLTVENTLKYSDLVGQEFNEIDVLKNENLKLKNEIIVKEEFRKKLFDMIIVEAEGKSPTGVIGKGPVYIEKKQEYDKIDYELTQLSKRNNLLIEKNNKQIDELSKIKNQQLKLSETEIKNADGLLARLEAMSVLSNKSSTVKYASWFIFLLFVLIESAPVLVKLLSRRGAYDELIEKEEYEKMVEYKKQKIKAKTLANNYIELLQQKNILQVDSEKRNNESLIKQIEDAKEEINQEAIKLWKQKEIKTLYLEEIIEQENIDDKVEENIEKIDVREE
ncbi:MAG: DUF4407 domain-containing protein [Bacteroidales bacterium]|nr:DUF4407 domain-containing protein [Bacteroidales bacterium]MBN2758086.1 DUF4407 domain-containing protein [Bacteroidales bacterium]